MSVVSFLLGFLDILLYALLFGYRLRNYFQRRKGEPTFWASLSYVVRDWFRRGDKGYSYLTLMFGTIFFVGAYQVGVAKRNEMNNGVDRLVSIGYFFLDRYTNLDTWK